MYQTNIPKNEILSWITSLVADRPFYGSPGINLAQTKVYNYLCSEWDQVYFDKFSYDDIKNLEGALDVRSYGEMYKDYHQVDKFNVYAEFDTKIPGPILLLTGHIDVDIIESDFDKCLDQKYQLHDRKIFGRGSADMLSGLMVMMICATHIITNKLLKKGKIVFASVCDEEIGGNGTIRALDFFKKNNIIDFNNKNNLCIIGEPTELKQCSQSLSFLNLDIIFSGDSCHMGVVDREATALSKFTEFCNNLDQLVLETIQEIVTCNNPSYRFNIGKVSGGIDNAIPPRNIKISCTIFLEQRVDNNLFFAKFKNRLASQFGASAIMDPLSFEGADFTQQVSSTFSLVGRELFPSPCDARLFSSHIPTIIWGPGSLKQAHQLDEYISVDEVFSFYDSLYQFITKSIMNVR